MKTIILIILLTYSFLGSANTLEALSGNQRVILTNSDCNYLFQNRVTGLLDSYESRQLSYFYQKYNYVYLLDQIPSSTCSDNFREKWNLNIQSAFSSLKTDLRQEIDELNFSDQVLFFNPDHFVISKGAQNIFLQDGVYIESDELLNLEKPYLRLSFSAPLQQDAIMINRRECIRDDDVKLTCTNGLVVDVVSSSTDFDHVNEVIFINFFSID